MCYKIPYCWRVNRWCIISWVVLELNLFNFKVCSRKRVATYFFITVWVKLTLLGPFKLKLNRWLTVFLLIGRDNDEAKFTGIKRQKVSSHSGQGWGISWVDTWSLIKSSWFFQEIFTNGMSVCFEYVIPKV